MQKQISKLFIAFTALLFFVIACSTNYLLPTPTTLPSPTPIILPDFSLAYSIIIIDNWSGLSPIAPMNSLYILENPTNFFDKEHFQGNALFSIGGFRIKTKVESSALSISKNVVQSFLEKLSQAYPEEGGYTPSAPGYDDYPEITIRVLYGKAEMIEFYTASQGDEHVPWKITYGNKSYVVDSSIPMQALEILRPYLAQDVLNNLVQEQIKLEQQ